MVLYWHIPWLAKIIIVSLLITFDMVLSKLRLKLGFLVRNKSCFPFFTQKRIVEAVFLSVLDCTFMSGRPVPLSNLLRQYITPP